MCNLDFCYRNSKYNLKFWMICSLKKETKIDYISPFRSQIRSDWDSNISKENKLMIINMEEEKLTNIDVREMALKSTKRAEIYKVLTTTWEIYLPPVDQINSDFIREILSGDKLVGFLSYF